MIASGPLPPNPAEMIGSEKVRALIEYAEGKYDYVLYDTPPVGLVTDAAVLSKNVDGVLFVARYATTNVEAAKAAKESLDNVDARIIGCVITDVEKDGYRKKKYYSYKGYNYGYGGYGEYGGYNREE
jgi:capsular exopolysaccharide synthesis family protein